MRQPQYYSGDGVFFDTHAHIADRRFEEAGITVSDILQRASEAGVKRILIPGDSEKSSRKAVSVCLEMSGLHGVELFCSVGIHPHEAKDYTEDTGKYLREMLSLRKENRLCALGEIGLDYYYDFSPRDVQKEVFKKQLELAYEYDIPMILHERDATGDCLDILKDFHKRGQLRKVPGVCHCCTMSPEAAREIVKLGFYIGFDGPLTFKNNKKGPVLAQETPEDRIVIETDSPYITPEPNRGLTNEPCFVPFVAQKLAEIRNTDIERIAEITYHNGSMLYEI
ncbi:MAG: TatD family hydrolase [Clostridiales bacterium]|nr:TatD family hydrolase [Clostridiales bacterium]